MRSLRTHHVALLRTRWSRSRSTGVADACCKRGRRARRLSHLGGRLPRELSNDPALGLPVPASPNGSASTAPPASSISARERVVFAASSQSRWRSAQRQRSTGRRCRRPFPRRSSCRTCPRRAPIVPIASPPVGGEGIWSPGRPPRGRGASRLHDGVAAEPRSIRASSSASPGWTAPS